MAYLTADRRNRMAQILLKDGSIKVGQMAELFDVTTETVRKDIIYLEEQGLAEKNHGGAIARAVAVEKTMDEKEYVHSEDKSEMALIAVSLIPNNATVILDAGSTTNAIARQLVLRSGLTIITNSLNSAVILADSDNDVYMTGGRLRKSSKGLVGGWALNSLASVHADIAFLGSDGFRDLNGPACLSYEEATLKNAVVKVSKETYVVADSSKSLSSCKFSYIEWGQVSGLITCGSNISDVKEVIGNRTRIFSSVKQ